MSISEQIKNAKPEEMSDIILAVLNRYNEVFPDWQLHIITFEKAVGKNEQIDAAIAFLEKMKDR